MEGEIGNSRIEITKDSVKITIRKECFGKKRWGQIVELIKLIISGSVGWLILPSTIGEGKGGKRWKSKQIEGISYIIYGLMIAPQNKLKRIYKAIDWSKIDEMCEEVYKNEKRGAPAYAPQMMYRILVLMFYSGTPFESETLRRLETDVLWRWFVGLGMLSKVPDKGTLSKYRKRIGVERFEKILIGIIEACDKAGLIGHKESFYDMTGVEASATAMTPYQRAVILAKAMSKYLEEKGKEAGISKVEIAEIALEVLEKKHSSLKKVKAQSVVKSAKSLEEKLETGTKKKPRWWRRLKEKWGQIRQNWSEDRVEKIAQVREIAEKLVAELPQTFGNADAKVGRMNKTGTLCGYRSGFLVDAKKRIITAVIFVAVTSREAPTLLTALSKHQAIFQRYPQRLGLDAAFDDDEVHRQMALWNIESVTSVRTRTGAKGLFRTNEFVWNEQKQLICPGGKQMHKCGGPYKNGAERYRPVENCSACPLFQQCLTPKTQAQKTPLRQIDIKTEAHQRAQENRQRCYSPQGQSLRHRRFASEGLFGHLNSYHNGDKAPYRSATMDHIAQLMVASISNLEQLARHSQT